MQSLFLILSVLTAVAFHSPEVEDTVAVSDDNAPLLMSQRQGKRVGFVNHGLKEYWWHDAHLKGIRDKHLNSGYIHEWTVSPQYEYASKRFGEGLAAVVLNGKTGYIDQENRFIIVPRFEADKFPKPFSQGLSIINAEGRQGYIDKRGNIIIDPKFDDAEPFGDNLIAFVKSEGRYGAIDLKGDTLIACRHTTPESMTMGKNQEAWKSAEALVQKRLGQGYYDDVLNKIRRSEEYADAFIADPDFRNEVPSGVYIADTLGFFGLKKDGSWLTGASYESVTPLVRGYYQLQNAGKSGICDSYGRILIDPGFDEIVYQPAEDIFIVKDSEGKYGLYDHKGAMILPTSLDRISDFNGGRAECAIGTVVGYIDPNGQILDTDFYGNVINMSMLESDVESRKAILRQLIRFKPTCAQAHNNLAACYMSVEKYKIAVPILKLAHELDPEDVIIADNLRKAKDGRKDKIMTATFVVVGVVASVALAAVAIVADVASTDSAGGGGGGGSSDGGSGSSSSSGSGSRSSSGGVTQGELQSQYDDAIDNIRDLKNSWSDHVGTQGEVTNRQNLNSIKQTIKKIKSRAREKGYNLRTDSLENWNP